MIGVRARIINRWVQWLIAVLLAAALALTMVLAPPAWPRMERKVTVIIPPGVTARQVGEILKQAGVIRSPLAFRVLIRLREQQAAILPGRYTLSTAMFLPRVVDKLISGERDEIIVTVPEGFTLKEIGHRLAEAGYVSEEEFNAALVKENFNFSFLPPKEEGKMRLEGYLFPDTYRLPAGGDAYLALRLMLERFAARAEEMQLLVRCQARGISLHQLVTIASMVEREAKWDAERPLIAGVIYNRWQRGMPLQVDATVEYALGSRGRALSYHDLKVASPYNTYLYTGLPPGPIAAPGMASLLAALEPAEVPYLYYVARPDGSHAFAVTYKEHLSNIARYQKSR